MTDIAIPDHRAEVAQQASRATIAAPQSALVAWADEAQIAERLASKLAASSFVPASLRGKPMDVTAAILAGLELGLQPMATLRSMDVIQGTPALRAHAMRGLVQSHGHEVELVESTPARCVMRGRRKGSDAWQTVVWTIQRAEQLGLVNKSEWKKQAQTMLVARATGEVCRLIAADALYAMPYAAEELREATPRSADVSAARPRVTLDEIVGSHQVEQVTVEQLPAPESRLDEEASFDEPLDEFTVLWSKILAAGERRGWTAEQTEREFAEGNNGIQAGASEIGPLQGFLAFLGGAA